MPKSAATPTPRASTHRRIPRSIRKAWADAVRPPARHASRARGVLRFTALSALALVPGAGLLAAGRRLLGGLLLLPLVVVGVVAVHAVAVGQARASVLRLAVRPSALLAIAISVALVALVWCASIALTAWSTRPRHTTRPQRIAGTAFVALLVLAVAVPGVVTARYLLIQRHVVQTVFAAGTDAPQTGVAAPTGRRDPWQGTPRVNVLLLGSDAGKDRTGVRPDSMIVASIDTSSGRTVLLGLPRNLQNVPFPASNPLHAIWPDGFDCGNQCLLNAVWEQAEQRRDLFPGDPHPGLTTTRGVIGEILGLRIDYYTVLDLEGFSGLVDAMGGVVVDVPREIPIGGGHNLRTGAQLPIHGYIHQGTQRLDGHQALWFARSREGSDDYDRMERQRCMVGALLDQSDPVRLLASYPRLAKVLEDNLQTDVPRGDLPAWVTLVERIQHASISSLPFTKDVISTVRPDFDKIRALVAKAIEPPATAPKTSAPKTSGPTATAPKAPDTPSTAAPKPAEALSLSATC